MCNERHRIGVVVGILLVQQDYFVLSLVFFLVLETSETMSPPASNHKFLDLIKENYNI